MRSHALLCAALVASCSQAAHVYRPRGLNSTASTSSSALSTSGSTSKASSSVTDRSLSLDDPVVESSASVSVSTSSTVSSSGSTITSHASSSLSSSSSQTPSTNVSATTPCTGCVLEAYNPSSTWFSSEWSSSWVPVVVTVGTEVTNYYAYVTGTPATTETVVTNITTVNVTKTVFENNATFAHTTPSFVVTPTAGVEVTLPAGPTYLIYQSIFGGLDYRPTRTKQIKPTDAESTSPAATDIFDAITYECEAHIDKLDNLLPSDAEGWKYFITTVKSVNDEPTLTPVPLPPGLVDYLKQDPDITSIFNGSDIASCTLRRTRGAETITLPESTSETDSPPAFSTPEATEPAASPAPSSFLSTIYDTTTSHITVHGCLRCDTQKPIVPPTEGTKTKPHDNHPHTDDKPNVNNLPTNSPLPKQKIPIGDSTYTVYPVRPTQPSKPHDPEKPNQGNPNPNIAIGTQTFTPGQTGTINGVPVVIPTAGQGTKIIVGGSTVGVNPLPTGPPVLTLGETVVTANTQGHFSIGGKTLTPGGPAITVDGSTLSLGPSGTVAVINGATQTLGNAPYKTPPPVLTVDGKEILATVLGGTTQFVIGNGKTLTPGGSLTVDGTTYSLPKSGSGSTVVVNGVTTTLKAPTLPVLTLGAQSSLTATVKDGTTEFVLDHGKTLTPGGVLTVDGTTYSLPKDGSGSTVVVNGITSTLGGLPVLSLNTKSAITATVKGGTTAFILGPGKTLTPGGALTVGGTTYSLPKSESGSVIVVNGVTSTLGYGPITSAAALTIKGKTYSPTVRDGTTEYVIGRGTTIKPGDAVTIDGTTYSLDKEGTALVVNGKTSTLPKTPASNSASATKSSSDASSTDDSSSAASSSTTERKPGNFIASGLGISSKAGAVSVAGGGVDKWVESMVMGIAGWILMLA